MSALFQQLSSHLTVVLGWNQSALPRAAAEDASAECISSNSEFSEHSHAAEGPQPALPKQLRAFAKKTQNRYLLRSTPACAQATTTSASSKRKAEGDHIHITLQAEVTLIQSPLERSNSCSVGSVVLWICLATPLCHQDPQHHPSICKDFSLLSARTAQTTSNRKTELFEVLLLPQSLL